MGIYTIDTLPPSLRKSALAIGKFDGVHQAHQALVKKACEIKGLKSAGAMTFSPHPSLLLSPEKPIFKLNTDEQKANLLFDLGLDFLIIQPITADFLKLHYQDFIDSILIEKLGVGHVVVGHDFSFGHHAEGRAHHLAEAAKNHGFNLHLIDDVYVEGQRCSSTAIRTLLQGGDLDKVRAMLGRPYSLFGRVSSGLGLGTPLGFATANIKPPPGFALLMGIYATTTRVHTPTGHRDFLSATSVGIRPTVIDSNELLIETHCLDQKIDLLHQDLEIFFIERLRDELKFASLEELKSQMSMDLHDTRALAQKYPGQFACN